MDSELSKKELFIKSFKEEQEKWGPEAQPFLNFLLSRNEYVEAFMLMEDHIGLLIEEFEQDSRMIYFANSSSSIPSPQVIARYPYGGHEAFKSLIEELAIRTASMVDDIFEKYIKSNQLNLGHFLNKADTSKTRETIQEFEPDDTKAHASFLDLLDILKEKYSDQLHDVGEAHNKELPSIRRRLLYCLFRDIYLKDEFTEQLLKESHRQEVVNSMNKERSQAGNKSKSAKWQPVKDFSVHLYNSGTEKHKRKAAYAMANKVREFAKLEYGVEMTVDLDNVGDRIYKWLLQAQKDGNLTS